MNRLTSIERRAGIGSALMGAFPGVAVPMLLIVSSQDIEVITIAFLIVALALPPWWAASAPSWEHRKLDARHDGALEVGHRAGLSTATLVASLVRA
jgi:hypothetical protein